MNYTKCIHGGEGDSEVLGGEGHSEVLGGECHSEVLGGEGHSEVLGKENILFRCFSSRSDFLRCKCHQTISQE